MSTGDNWKGTQKDLSLQDAMRILAQHPPGHYSIRSQEMRSDPTFVNPDAQRLPDNRDWFNSTGLARIRFTLAELTGLWEVRCEYILLSTGEVIDCLKNNRFAWGASITSGGPISRLSIGSMGGVSGVVLRDDTSMGRSGIPLDILFSPEFLIDLQIHKWLVRRDHFSPSHVIGTPTK